MTRSLALAIVPFLLTACGSPPVATVPVASGSATLAAPSQPATPAALATPSGAVSAPPPPPRPAEVVPEPERVELTPEIETLLAASDRLPEDKALDLGRQPGATLVFYGIAPGMHVAELGAGTGYFTELLARAVTPGGLVFAENPKAVTEGASASAWKERLGRPPLVTVVRVDRELESPLPPEAKNLDAVFVALIYHDLYRLNVDRGSMNRAIFAALKPGGIYAVIDHAAKPGQGTSVVSSLRRIEASEVIRDVQASGFVLDGEATFLRNPRDTKDWSTAATPGAEKHGTSDRFVLRFKRPN